MASPQIGSSIVAHLAQDGGRKTNSEVDGDILSANLSGKTDWETLYRAAIYNEPRCPCKTTNEVVRGRKRNVLGWQRQCSDSFQMRSSGIRKGSF